MVFSGWFVHKIILSFQVGECAKILRITLFIFNSKFFCKTLMKIIKAEILTLSIPMIEPFMTGFGVFDQRDIILLKLYDQDGRIGIGESANFNVPIYMPDFNSGTISLLREHLVPLILKNKINEYLDIENILNTVVGNNIAKSLIDMAYWHLKSQIENKTLSELWGGKQEKIKAAISIGMEKDLNLNIQKIIKIVSDHNPLRIKIKIKPGLDVNLISAVRKEFPDLKIQVDANASFKANDMDILEKLDQYNLTMIEQPFEALDLLSHAKLQSRIKTPVCLDESAENFLMTKQAIELKACKIVNIKPARVGGFYQAKKISDLCEQNNIPVWCGGMIESGWGQYFNCHIATLNNFKFVNDICLTKWYLKDDIINKPINESNGVINISDLADIQIDDEKVNYYLQTKIVIK